MSENGAAAFEAAGDLLFEFDDELKEFLSKFEKDAGVAHANKLRAVFAELKIDEMSLLGDYRTVTSLKDDFGNRLCVGELNRFWRALCVAFNYKSERTLEAAVHNDTIHREHFSARYSLTTITNQPPYN